MLPFGSGTGERSIWSPRPMPCSSSFSSSLSPLAPPFTIDPQPSWSTMANPNPTAPTAPLVYPPITQEPAEPNPSASPFLSVAGLRSLANPVPDAAPYYPSFPAASDRRFDVDARGSAPSHPDQMAGDGSGSSRMWVDPLEGYSPNPLLDATWGILGNYDSTQVQGACMTPMEKLAVSEVPSSFNSMTGRGSLSTAYSFMPERSKLLCGKYLENCGLQAEIHGSSGRSFINMHSDNEHAPIFNSMTGHGSLATASLHTPESMKLLSGKYLENCGVQTEVPKSSGALFPNMQLHNVSHPISLDSYSSVGTDNELFSGNSCYDAYMARLAASSPNAVPYKPSAPFADLVEASELVPDDYPLDRPSSTYKRSSDWFAPMPTERMETGSHSYHFQNPPEEFGCHINGSCQNYGNFCSNSESADGSDAAENRSSWMHYSDVEIALRNDQLGLDFVQPCPGKVLIDANSKLPESVDLNIPCVDSPCWKGAPTKYGYFGPGEDTCMTAERSSVDFQELRYSHNESELQQLKILAQADVPKMEHISAEGKEISNSDLPQESCPEELRQDNPSCSQPPAKDETCISKVLERLTENTETHIVQSCGAVLSQISSKCENRSQDNGAFSKCPTNDEHCTPNLLDGPVEQVETHQLSGHGQNESNPSTEASQPVDAFSLNERIKTDVADSSDVTLHTPNLGVLWNTSPKSVPNLQLPDITTSSGKGGAVGACGLSCRAGEDIKLLINSIHNLSQVLITACNGRYDMEDPEVELLQSSMANLAASVSMRKKEQTKSDSFASNSSTTSSDEMKNDGDIGTFGAEDKSVHTTSECFYQEMKNTVTQDEPKSDAFATYSSRTNLHVAKTDYGDIYPPIVADKSVRATSECFDQDVMNSAMQAIGKLPRDGIFEIANAETTIYKNLWMQTEVSLCKMKYELELARMKLDMRNYQHDKKDASDQTRPLSSALPTCSASRTVPETPYKRQCEESCGFVSTSKPLIAERCNKESGADAALMARLEILKSRDAVRNDGHDEKVPEMINQNRESLHFSPTCHPAAAASEDIGSHEANTDRKDEVDTSVMAGLKHLKAQGDSDTSKPDHNEKSFWLMQALIAARSAANDEALEADSDMLDEVDPLMAARIAILKSRADRSACDQHKPELEADPNAGNDIEPEVMARLKVLKARLEASCSDVNFADSSLVSGLWSKMAAGFPSLSHPRTSTTGLETQPEYPSPTSVSLVEWEYISKEDVTSSDERMMN